MQEKATFTVELINNILTYLGTRPYAEVAPFIAEIQKQYAMQKEEDKKEK